MKREVIISEFLEQNPALIDADIEFSSDGRLQWFCEHGHAHTVFSPKNKFKHSPCCGCCRKIVSLDGLSHKSYLSNVYKQVYAY